MLDQYKRTHVRIDLDAVRENVRHMKENLPEETGIMAVIKADGYGHGAVPIAEELEPITCIRGFAVATAEEALLLREAGIQKDILILGYVFPEHYEELIRRKIRLTVFREDSLPRLEAAAERAGEPVILHLKVDTGMSRIGVRPDDGGVSFVKKILTHQMLQLEGIFTHFAKSDESDKTFARKQYRIFCDFEEKIRLETGYRIPVRHCANSAAILELPETGLSMARAGITLYGLWPSDAVSREIMPLHPALSWYSRIVYCKTVQPGTPIGYGGTFTAEAVMRIATIPVGYADGYPRSLSNRGYVLIRGERAPILGRVCMDQFMVDVTHIPEAEEDDPVVLLGSDGTQCISAEQLGALSGRFNYELVCDIGKRVPRVFYRRNEPVASEIYNVHTDF